MEGSADGEGGDHYADEEGESLQAGRGADQEAGLEVLRGVAGLARGDADHAADGDGKSAEGRGGPQERPLHPWQQALEPVWHWIRQVSEPGELVVDPFLGSGTTAVAAVLEGRRFLGCDLDPGCAETTRRRLVDLAARPENDEAGA